MQYKVIVIKDEQEQDLSAAETHFFKSLEEARMFVDNFNKINNADLVITDNPRAKIVKAPPQYKTINHW